MHWMDIPTPRRFSGYTVDVSWDYLEKWLARQAEDMVTELNPDFQRGHVWNAEQKSKYVEFGLQGGESAKNIYWNCPNYTMGSDMPGPMLLVDGLQRVTAIREFLQNEVEIFGGSFARDFTGRMGSRNRLTFHVNQLNTRAEVLDWYLLLNDGGVVHSQEELNRVRELLRVEQRRTTE